MSRSYKKTPSCHIVARDSWYKKHYNRKLRRNRNAQDIPDGNAYRKMNETWNIDDWHDVASTFEEFRKRRIQYQGKADEATYRNEYEKWYFRK